MWGKGFLQGTQGHLNFLPEKQTDFIFTMLAEEFGFVGCLAMMGLLLLIVLGAMAIALRCRHQFGRLVALGIGVNFFLYVAVNIAMVTGAIPVGGVPMPLVSYGGSASLTVMLGFGILMSCTCTVTWSSRTRRRSSPAVPLLQQVRRPLDRPDHDLAGALHRRVGMGGQPVGHEQHGRQRAAQVVAQAPLLLAALREFALRVARPSRAGRPSPPRAGGPAP